MSNKALTTGAAALLTTLLCGSALADSYVITGDTTGNPTWNRLYGSYPKYFLSGTGTNTPYAAFEFRIVDLMAFRAETVAPTAYDTTLALYQNSFDPTDQFTNIISYNDDGGAGLLSRVTATSDGPVTLGDHVLVLSGFGNSHFGPFVLEIDGVLFLFDDFFVNSMLGSGIAGTAGQMIGSFGSRVSGGNGSDSAISTNGSDAPLGDIGIMAWAKGAFSATDASGDLGGLGTSGSYTQDANFIQGGFSSVFINDERGRAIASLFAHYGTSDALVKRATGATAGTWDTTGYGVGAALTWIDAAGWYVDVVGQYTAFDVDTTTAVGGTGSTDASATALQVSAGWKLTPLEGVALVPQAGLTYQLINIDTYTDSFGTVSSFSSNDSFEGRIGVKLATDDHGWANASIEANIVNEFLDGGTTTVAGTPIGFDLSGAALELGAGLSVTPQDTGVRLWTKAAYRTPFEDGRETASVSGGFSWSF